jgi:P-type Cu2+ transporter
MQSNQLEVKPKTKLEVKSAQITPAQSVAGTGPASFMLDVSGMKCAGCVRAVENQLLQQSGVVTATVNLVTEAAMVQCEAGVDPAGLAATLTEKGFPTQLRGAKTLDGLTPAETQQLETQRQMRQVVIALALLLFSAISHLDHFGWISVPGLDNMGLHWGLATLALLFPGRPILLDGWRGLRHNLPNMNTLVGLGTLTAYIASLVALLFPTLGWECFFDEPVMLIGFILLGRALEQQARSRATSSFQALVALQPSVARLVNPGLAQIGQPEQLEQSSERQSVERQSIEIPASQVKLGEWLQVLPGEKIPVDGEVVNGQTTVNEAMLTGEALPILKQKGDSVTAGSLNLSGLVTLKATRTGKDTTLAQIIDLVETAQTRKAPIQGLADQVAGYFTYGVITLALLTFLFWYFVGIPLWSDQILTHLHIVGLHPISHTAAHTAVHTMAMSIPPSPLLLSLKLAIAVLVIACPCALGLATPTAILVGSSLGAEKGLLIRGGDVLEKVHQVQTVVFDKTGTLTQGQPTVTDCFTRLGTDQELLQLAASAESGTQHPLGLAIQQAAAQRELPLLSATAFHTEPGLGITATVVGKSVVIGTADWLTQQAISLDSVARTQAQTLAAAGKTPVYVGAEGRLLGLLGVQDQLRPDAKASLRQLRQMGLQIRLLTGDQLAVAESIAAEIELTESDLAANLRPAAKAAAIETLQQSSSGLIAMIGDGINDAPALAQADIGIAMNSGTEVAMETAEIILIRDQLSDVVEAIRLSRATFNKIRQNLFWAFIYNALSLPIAAGALLPAFGIVLSPATAGALMAFSSVSVVTNSLLLRRT